jgi:hypothetical protein
LLNKKTLITKGGIAEIPPQASRLFFKLRGSNGRQNAENPIVEQIGQAMGVGVVEGKEWFLSSRRQHWTAVRPREKCAREIIFPGPVVLVGMVSG